MAKQEDIGLSESAMTQADHQAEWSALHPRAGEAQLAPSDESQTPNLLVLQVIAGALFASVLYTFASQFYLEQTQLQHDDQKEDVHIAGTSLTPAMYTGGYHPASGSSGSWTESPGTPNFFGDNSPSYLSDGSAGNASPSPHFSH